MTANQRKVDVRKVQNKTKNESGILLQVTRLADALERIAATMEAQQSSDITGLPGHVLSFGPDISNEKQKQSVTANSDDYAD